MKITLTYKDRTVVVEGQMLEGLSHAFREYVDDIIVIYIKHMKKLNEDEKRTPVGKIDSSSG